MTPAQQESPDVVPSQSRTKRLTYFCIGWVFFALGILGVVLPVVPTTPFMILALWAFSQSSARFHGWLLRHPTFGPRLQQWRRHRVIPLPVKLTAWAAMIASLVVATFVARAPWPVLAVTAAVMVAGTIYIVRCPSRPPRE